MDLSAKKNRVTCFALMALSFVASNGHGQMTPLPTPSPEPVPALEAEIQPTGRSRGPIHQIRFEGLHAMDEEIVADVAELNVGEEFTYARLENSINSLRKWGVFSQVEIIVQHESQGISLIYQLKEGFIIKDIVIRGNFPLLDTEVRRAMFLNPGEIYDNARLPEQVDRLDRLYQQHGYYDSTVLAVEDYNESKREVTLRFEIKKGRTYRLRNLDVTGNTALSPQRIRRIIFTYSHYKPRALKKNMEKVRNLYKKKGWVRARVKLDKETFDYDARKVDIALAVRQGKHVFVVFEGNDHFWNRTLRKQITIYEDGDFDEYELDASKEKLKRFYLQKGYEDVKVEWKREKLDPDNYLVTFIIDEGKQRKVTEIEFEGTGGIQKKKLKEVMLTKEESLSHRGYYLEPLFKEDLKLIENYYRDEGFLDAKVEGFEKEYTELGDKVILTVKVTEQEQAIVEKLNLPGLPGQIQEELQPTLLSRPGQPYSPSRVDQDIQTILVRLANEGHPYAEIKHDERLIGDRLWEVDLKVDTGPKVHIGRILFVGNSLTRESVIRRNLRFKEGSEFSAKDLLQSQINLRRLGVFDRVTVETLGLANKETKVHALISMQEKKTKIIDLEASYNTDTLFSGKLVFNKLNMWGSGKHMNIKLQGGQEISRFEVNYIDPRVMGKSLQLLVGIFVGYENRPFFENTAAGALSTLFKDFSAYLSAYGRLQFDAVNFDESKTVASEVDPSENVTDHTRFTSTLGVTYDRRDNFGNPTRGYYLNAQVSFANQFIQASGNFFAFGQSLGYWYSPFPRITIANALRMGQIIPVPGNTVIPVDARLYLGGDDTVRGFSQDSLLPTGGNYALVHNLELQITPFGNFQVVGFLDTGIVVESLSQVNLTNLRHSIGPGVRYKTPVGPIRLEYGFKLDPQPGESAGRLHFSFGYFF